MGIVGWATVMGCGALGAVGVGMARVVNEYVLHHVIAASLGALVWVACVDVRHHAQEEVAGAEPDWSDKKVELVLFAAGLVGCAVVGLIEVAEHYFLPHIAGGLGATEGSPLLEDVEGGSNGISVGVLGSDGNGSQGGSRQGGVSAPKWALAAGLVFHSMPEAMAVYVLAEENWGSGIPLALVVGLHTFALAVPLGEYPSTLLRMGFVVAIMASFAIGGGIAELLTHDDDHDDDDGHGHHDSNIWVGLLLATAVGMLLTMAYLSIAPAIYKPSSQVGGKRRFTTACVMAGWLVCALLLALLHTHDHDHDDHDDHDHDHDHDH